MIQLIRAFWWIIAIPLVAFLFFYTVKSDPGYILISGTVPFWNIPLTLEMRFAGFIISLIGIFLIAYILIRIIFRLISLPFAFKRYANKKLENSASQYFTRAELALLEDDPQLAEELYIAITKTSANPSLCYFGAARAAHAQKKFDKRDQYLASMDYTEDKNNLLLAGILRGEFLNSIGEYQKAKDTLLKLNQHQSNHYRVLTALAHSYKGLDEFDNLYQLMPKLHKALPLNERSAIEPDLYLSLIDYTDEYKDLSALQELWNHIPKEMKYRDNIVINYTQKLLGYNDAENAEKILRTAIKKEWNELLITAYGHLNKGNMAKYIKIAKKFSEEHQESAYAAIAVARLNVRERNHDDAITYLKMAQSINPTLPEIHHLFAEILLDKGDYEASALSFREAAKLTYAKPSKNVTEVEGELLATSNNEVEQIEHIEQKES